MFPRLRTFEPRKRWSDAHGEPGREDEGREQRKQHRHRPKGRNGLHVRPHHARDESHRQQGGDDGKGGENGWVAHLAHGIDRGFGVDLPFFQPAAIDVFDHHDGIIHQNANREDQREQAHPVDGIPQDIGREHGDQNHHRDHDQHHDRRPEPQQGPDQNGHDGGCDEQLEDQFIDLVVGGRAIVAGDRNLYVVRNQTALQIVHLFQNRVGHCHAVAAGFLGDGDGHRRRAVGCPRVFGEGGTGVIHDHVMRIGRGFPHLGDVAHVDGGAVAYPHHQPLHIDGIAQERTGVDLVAAVPRLHMAGAAFTVGILDRFGDLVEADPEPFQPFGKHLDPQFLGPSADDGTLAGVGDLLQALHHIEGEQAQLGIGDVVGPKGQRHHRHIVHPLRLDHGADYPRGNLVLVRLELIVKFDKRCFHAFAHVELDRRHALPALGCRIDMFDTGDFAQQPFQRIDGKACHLLRRRTGIANEHIHHRHRNLRIFLPRRDQKPENTHGERGQQQEGRERRMDEGPGHGAGQPQPVMPHPVIVVRGLVFVIGVNGVLDHGHRSFATVFPPSGVFPGHDGRPRAPECAYRIPDTRPGGGSMIT